MRVWGCDLFYDDLFIGTSMKNYDVFDAVFLMGIFVMRKNISTRMNTDFKMGIVLLSI